MDKDNNNNKVEDITKKRHEDFKNKVNEKPSDNNREEVELLASLVAIGDEINDNNKTQSQTLSFELKDKLKSMGSVIKDSFNTIPKTKFINPIQSFGNGASNRIASLVEDINKKVGLSDVNNIDGLENIRKVLIADTDDEVKPNLPDNIIDKEDEKKKKKERETLVDKLINSFGKGQYNIMRIMRDQMFEFSKKQASKNRVLLAGLRGIVYNPVTKTIIARLGDINRSVKESGKSFFGGLDRLFGGKLSPILNLISGFMGKIGSGFTKLNSSLGGIGGKVVKAGAVAGVAMSAMSGYNKIQAIKNDDSLSEEEKNVQLKEAKFETGGQVAGGAIGGILGSFLGPVGTMVGSMLGDFIGGWVGKFLSGVDFSNLWDTVKNGFLSAWDSISSIVLDIGKGIWETVSTFMDNVVPNIGKFISDMVEDIRKSLPTMEDFLKIVSDMWDTYVSYATKFGDMIFKALGDAFDLAVDGVMWVIDHIPDLIKDTISLIIKAIPKIASFLRGMMFNIGKFLIKTLIKIPKILLNIVLGIVKGVFKLTTSLRNMWIGLIKKLPTIIWEFIKSVPSLIWKGVTAIWDLMTEQFKSMMNGLVVWLDDAMPDWDWLKSDKWIKMAENARKEMAIHEEKVAKENNELISKKEKNLENEKKLLGLEEESQELRFTSDMFTNRLSDEENAKFEAKAKPKQNELDFLNTVSGIGIGNRVALQGESSIRTDVLNNEYHTSKEIEKINNITPVILNNNSNVVNNETRTQTLRIVNTQNMDFTSNRYNVARVI